VAKIEAVFSAGMRVFLLFFSFRRVRPAEFHPVIIMMITSYLRESAVMLAGERERRTFCAVCKNREAPEQYALFLCLLAHFSCCSSAQGPELPSVKVHVFLFFVLLGEQDHCRRSKVAFCEYKLFPIAM
jgi:hypothetical protein